MLKVQGISKAENDTEEEKNRLIATLTDDEGQALQWLREGYSPKWIAETMMISRVEMRRIKKSILEKLHVSNTRDLLMHYAVMDQSTVTIDIDQEHQALRSEEYLHRLKR